MGSAGSAASVETAHREGYERLTTSYEPEGGIFMNYGSEPLFRDRVREAVEKSKGSYELAYVEEGGKHFEAIVVSRKFIEKFGAQNMAKLWKSKELRDSLMVMCMDMGLSHTIIAGSESVNSALNGMFISDCVEIQI